MSRTCNPYDNGMMERFFRTLKDEEVYLTEYADDREAQASIRRFVRSTTRNGYTRPWAMSPRPSWNFNTINNDMGFAVHLSQTAKRVTIYARVSTKDQHPETQVNDLRRYARDRALKVVKVYEEKASGKRTDRPEFQKLLDDIRKRKTDAVLVWKLDRLDDHDSL